MKHFLIFARALFNMRREIMGISLWLVLICVIMVPQVLNAQVGTNKNHYKTWMTQPIPDNKIVAVQDQFMFDMLTLTGIEFLSNPTLKVHEGLPFPIINPNDHLTWYRAVGRDTSIKLKYENQFESTITTIGSAEYLLVPTQKMPHDPPVNLDHYKAYRIKEPKTLHTPVMLQDQFDEMYGLPEFIDSLLPTYFLTPAVKNMEKPIYDTVTHYVAYQIFPPQFLPTPPPLEVYTMDQFGPHYLQIMNSMFLLVPTNKILLGSIEGYKFHDRDGDGVKDPSEEGLQNWAINLTGPVTQTVYTDINGHYYFGDLTPGAYVVTEDVQTGWFQSYPPPPGQHNVSIVNGEHFIDKDFGNYMSGSIDGYKFHDGNGNGIREPGEEGLHNWAINLTGPVNQTTYTDINGHYYFGGLPAGDYVLTEDNQSGWIQSYPLPPGKHNVSLPPEGVIGDKNFGNCMDSIFITGTKYRDMDGDGVLDPEDTPLSGWYIDLRDSLRHVTYLDTTGVDGKYEFTHILPGLYTKKEILQPDWIATAPHGIDAGILLNITSDDTVESENILNFYAFACPAWTQRYDKKIEGMGFSIPTEAKLMTRNLAVDDSGYVYVCGYSDGWGTKNDYVTVKYDLNGNQQWVARYNNFAANKADKAYALVIDHNGNVYVTGESDFGGSKADIITVKYDAAGNQKWVKRWNGASNGRDAGYAIAINPSETMVYVTGETDGGRTSKTDYVTIGYDAALGLEYWSSTYNGPGYKVDKAYAIAVSPTDGSVIVTGESDGGTATSVDYATVKYNGITGAQVWVARYDGIHKKDYAFAIKTDAHGDAYVTGASDGGATKYDYATIKYSGAGAQIWVARYTNILTNKNDYGYDLALDQYGNVYVTGASEGLRTGFDYLTVKYNSAGIYQWENRFDSGIKKKDIARSIAVCDAEGKVFVTGSSDQGSGRKLDYVTLKIDATTGITDPSWPGRYNGTGKDDIAYNVVVRPFDCCVILTGTSDGGTTSKLDFATIQGSSGSPVPGPITSPPIYDGEDNEDVPATFALEQNFPNPFNPTTLIRFDLPVEAVVTLKVYDVLGQEIAVLLNQELLSRGYREVEFNAQNYPSGVYFYRIVAEGINDEGVKTNTFQAVNKMLLLK